MKARTEFQTFTGLLVALLLAAAASGAFADTLWDQLTKPGDLPEPPWFTPYFASQDFEPAYHDSWDCWGADDFYVGPGGWLVQSCEWAPAFRPFGCAEVIQVNFYVWPDENEDGLADFDNADDDKGAIFAESGMEDAILYDWELEGGEGEPPVVYGPMHFDFADPENPCVLEEGHYFLGIQIKMNYDSWLEAFWYTTSMPQQGDAAAMINPAGGLGYGTDWFNPFAPDLYDASFRLYGTTLESPLAPFVVLGEEGVWLKAGCQVLGGDVGANRASSNTFFDDLEVAVGLWAGFQDPESRLMGDRIGLGYGSEVHDVYYNELSGSGTVLGEEYTPLELPLVPGLPEVPAFTPGTTDVCVPWGETAVLDEGSYGDLLATGEGTVVFTGGEYDFESWLLGPDMDLCFEAPSEVRIAGRLFTGPLTYLGPAESADLDAPDIVLYVDGVNGRSEGDPLGAPSAAHFGFANTLIANVCVPSGTLRIGWCTKATGAFLGRWVDVGALAELEHSSGW